MILRFNDMPDHSRVWIYQSDKDITDLQAEEIRRKAAMFLLDWTSHGNVMKASIDVLYNRFIVVAVDESHASASGCGIDKSVRFMQQIEQDYGLNLFDRLLVAYRDAEHKIKTVKLQEFEQMMEHGSINAQTIVFNNMQSTKKDMLQHWEVPASASWHSRMIPVK
ncbi:MAG: hypothetical protein Fur0041_11600 [Bacteroidia bacterium]